MSGRLTIGFLSCAFMMVLLMLRPLLPLPPQVSEGGAHAAAPAALLAQQQPVAVPVPAPMTGQNTVDTHLTTVLLSTLIPTMLMFFRERYPAQAAVASTIVQDTPVILARLDQRVKELEALKGKSGG